MTPTLGPVSRVFAFVGGVIFTFLATLYAADFIWWAAIGFGFIAGVLYFGAATGVEIDNPPGGRGSFHLTSGRNWFRTRPDSPSAKPTQAAPPCDDSPGTA